MISAYIGIDGKWSPFMPFLCISLSLLIVFKTWYNKHIKTF